MIRYKYFHEMYDTFTSKGFEKNNEDNEVIRYKRFNDKYGVIQTARVDKTRKTMFDIGGADFRINVCSNEAYSLGFNLSEMFHDEKELYIAYEKMNHNITNLLDYWENNWIENQITARLNKEINDNYNQLYAEYFGDNSFPNISCVRETINNLKNNGNFSFEQFIKIASSVYIKYLEEKYNMSLKYKEETGGLLLINDKNKKIMPSKVVASFWYFGDSDCLERGKATWNIWLDFDYLDKHNQFDKDVIEWGEWINKLQYLGDDPRYKQYYPCIIE